MVIKVITSGDGTSIMKKIVMIIGILSVLATNANAGYYTGWTYDASKRYSPCASKAIIC